MRKAVTVALVLLGTAASICVFIGAGYALLADAPSNRADNPVAQVGVVLGLLLAGVSFLAAMAFFTTACFVRKADRDHRR